MITVVGIGADGWDGLAPPARAAIRDAPLLVGAARHLDLVPPTATAAPRRPWPSPMAPLVDELVQAGEDVCVLASGDPMLHGVGATLARRLGPDHLTVLPHVSAHALACARLGWPVAETELVSVVARPPETLAPALAPGRRLVVYPAGPGGAAAVARIAIEHGYGRSRFVVLEELGGPDERLVETTAEGHGAAARVPLHAVALECVSDGRAPLPRTPGLPDSAFEHDGQITRPEVRAITLAALGPMPGELLWDIGAGSGSIAIEWLRTHPACRAAAVEAREERARRAARNARRLGVPALQVVHGRAPAALDDLPGGPDAIFAGGGVTAPGLLDRCLSALRPGGRLVANAVTLEGEHALAAARERHGGTLTRVALAHGEPLGSFTTWRPALPVVQWSVRS